MGEWGVGGCGNKGEFTSGWLTPLFLWTVTATPSRLQNVKVPRTPRDGCRNECPDKTCSWLPYNQPRLTLLKAIWTLWLPSGSQDLSISKSINPHTYGVSDLKNLFVVSVGMWLTLVNWAEAVTRSALGCLNDDCVMGFLCRYCHGWFKADPYWLTDGSAATCLQSLVADSRGFIRQYFDIDAYSPAAVLF